MTGRDARRLALRVAAGVGEALLWAALMLAGGWLGLNFGYHVLGRLL